MDFIRVTLIEKLENGKKVSELQRIRDHFLPIQAIKYMQPHLTKEGVYVIEIIDSYKSDTKDFKLGFAEANNLPSGFYNVLN